MKVSTEKEEWNNIQERNDWSKYRKGRMEEGVGKEGWKLVQERKDERQ